VLVVLLLTTAASSSSGSSDAGCVMVLLLESALSRAQSNTERNSEQKLRGGKLDNHSSNSSRCRNRYDKAQGSALTVQLCSAAAGSDCCSGISSKRANVALLVH
jgi:hypothetical protein